MPLYNCRHAGDQYRITKFDGDMNVESTYLCTEAECDCPAGPRPTCRHRQMLPRFLARGAVGNEWFFDYDRGGWVQMGPEWVVGFTEEQGFSSEMQTALETDGEKLRQLTGEDHGPVFLEEPAPPAPPSRPAWRRGL